MKQIYCRPYSVRRAAVRGKEITLPVEVGFKPGDKVTAFFDGFVLFVPQGVEVDQKLLSEAIKIAERKAN